jgi:prolyl-tRNA editing enzyme YbaK/EbsC (Cys-tRNA(Pro) deacylase)
VDHPILGTLHWQPTSERVELLAAPVAAAVQALGLACFVAPIDPALADTAAFCAAYQVPLAASANCVVVAGRRGETTTTAACLVLATDRADVNKVVRRRLDVRKISFAGMDDAVRQTQMEHGGITPVGLPAGWPVLVDAAVAASDWVVIGSGVRGSKIAVRGAVLAALPGAETLALAVSAAG